MHKPRIKPRIDFGDDKAKLTHARLRDDKSFAEKTSKAMEGTNLEPYWTSLELKSFEAQSLL